MSWEYPCLFFFLQKQSVLNATRNVMLSLEEFIGVIRLPFFDHP